MAVSGLVTFILYSRVVLGLRTRHEATWRQLGAPTGLLNNSIRNGANFWLFNVRRKYRGLGDPELQRLFMWMNIASLVYGAAFVFLFSVLIAAVVSH